MILKSRAQMTTAVTNLKCDGGAHRPERRLIVAYLKYAVEDVAQYNEMSAALLRQAIACLEDSSAETARLRPQ